MSDIEFPDIEFPEVLEQDLQTSLFVGVGTTVSVYMPVGDPNNYPTCYYRIEELELIPDRVPQTYRTKLRRCS